MLALLAGATGFARWRWQGAGPKTAASVALPSPPERVVVAAVNSSLVVLANTASSPPAEQASATPPAAIPQAPETASPAVRPTPAANPTQAKVRHAPELVAAASSAAEIVPTAEPSAAASALAVVPPSEASSAAPASRPEPTVAPPAPPPAPRYDLASARVVVGSPVRVAGATAISVRRTVESASGPLTACYRAALPQMAQPVEGEGTLHIETDGAGIITYARGLGALSGPMEACMTHALRERRIANVDTGSASADIPLTFNPR